MALGRANKRSRDQLKWDNMFIPELEFKLTAEMLTELLNEHPEIIISFMAQFPQSVQNVISQHPEFITNSFSSDEFKNQVNNVITDDLLPTTEYELLDNRLIEFDSSETQHGYSIQNVNLDKYSRYIITISSKGSRGDVSGVYYSKDFPGKAMLIEDSGHNIINRTEVWHPIDQQTQTYVSLTQVFATGANQLSINYAYTSPLVTGIDSWVSVYGVIEK